MAGVAELIKEAKLLGLEEPADLQRYVQQARERDERQAMREAQEKEKERQDREREREYQLELAKISAQAAMNNAAMMQTLPTPAPVIQFDVPRYKEGESLEAYIAMFERAVIEYNLSDDAKGQRFCKMFSGKPRELIARMDPAATYDEIKQQLLQAYGKSLKEVKASFFACHMEEKETAQQFMNRVTACLDEWLEKEEVG